MLLNLVLLVVLQFRATLTMSYRKITEVKSFASSLIASDGKARTRSAEAEGEVHLASYCCEPSRPGGT